MPPSGCDSGHENNARDWTLLPDALLSNVFDIIITAPTAHPQYLAQKAKHVWRLSSVCKAWQNAVKETSIGVCLPATLSDEACTWVSNMMLRAIEFHDPERTEPKVLDLLSNPVLLERSSKTIISLIDAPCQKRTWTPSSFPNLTELVLWRPLNSRRSPIFDVRHIKDLTHLHYLVLASGFTGIRSMSSWPNSCKRMVWTCPSDAHSSKIAVPPIPPGIGLQWLSVRAYAVRIQDMSSMLGRISELAIHALYLFVTLPPSCYPSLTSTSLAPATAVATKSMSSRAKTWQRWKKEHDWTHEGLQTLSQMLVSDVGLLLFRLRFSRVLISQPTSGRFKYDSWKMLGLNNPSPDIMDTSGEGSSSFDEPPPSSDDEARAHCTHDEKGSSKGSHGDDDNDDLMYVEVTPPDQVLAAFQSSIDSYASMLSAQTDWKAFRTPQWPAMLMPTSSGLAGRRGLGRTSMAQNAPSLAPVDYSKVVPLLEGRLNSGQDREVMFTRKHQDPREPARYWFDQADKARASPSLRASLPGLLESTRPVQSVAFASWPYPSAEAVLGGESYDAPAPGPRGSGSTTAALCAAADVLSDADACAAGNADRHLGTVEPVLSFPSLHSADATELGCGSLCSHPVPCTLSGRESEEVESLDGSVSGGLVRQCRDGEEGAGAAHSTGTDSKQPSLSTQTQHEQHSKQPGLSAPPEQQLSWQEQYACHQRALITHPRFVASSAQTLLKINFLQLPRGWDEVALRSLFTPFFMLTKVSLISMDDPCCMPSAILPVTVVKVSFRAGNPNQRFSAKLISNLTELRRLSLHGYASLDLSAIPEVRPGMVLKIVEMPERQAPLGKLGVDVLMPKGRVVDMSLQVGTDTSVSNMDHASSPIITKVDLTSWAPLCKDINLRSPAGAELWYDTGSSNPSTLFQMLHKSALEQFTVCIATDMLGDIVAVPPSAATMAQRRQEGQRSPPVFAFASASGLRMHGVHLGMMVKHGRVGRGWDLKVMDASIVGDEEGLLFFAFFKSDENPGEHPGNNLPDLDPPGMAILATAQLQLQLQLQLQQLQQGGGQHAEVEQALAAATAMMGVPELTHAMEEEEGSGGLLDELD